MGSTIQLDPPIVYPSEATSLVTYSFKSLNTNFATVTIDGLVTIKNNCFTQIVCTTNTGLSDSLWVCGDNIGKDVNASNTTIYPLEESEYTIKTKKETGTLGWAYYNLFKFEYDDENLEITSSSKYTHDVFSYNLLYKKEVANDIDILVNGSFVMPNKDTLFTFSFIVTVKAKIKLNKDNLVLEKMPSSYSFNVYKDGNIYVDKRYNIPIYYDLDYSNFLHYEYNNFAIKVENDEENILFLDNSTLDNIYIYISDYNKLKDSYVIDFYPNKEVNEFISFTINFDVKEVTSSLSSISFEEIYTLKEGKENRLYLKNGIFESIFEKYITNNSEFDDLSLKIIGDETSLAHFDILEDKLGNFSSISLKEDENDSDFKCKFKIYPLYLYKNNKLDYYEEVVFDCKSKIDDIYIVFGQETIKESTYTLKSLSQYTKISAYPTFKSVCKEDKVEEELKKIENDLRVSVESCSFGHTTNSLGSNSSLFVSLTDYEGSLVALAKYEKDEISRTFTIFFDLNLPNLDNVKDEIILTKENEINKASIENLTFVTGDEFLVKTYLDEKSLDVTYSSSNVYLANVDENGLVKCLKEGSVVIFLKINSVTIKRYSLQIYDEVSSILIKQGSFTSLNKIDENNYTVYCVNGRTYSIDFDYINGSNRNINYKLISSNNGFYYIVNQSFITEKEGEDDLILTYGNGPYKKEINLHLIITNSGVNISLSEFANRLKKGVGHMTLFLFIGIFSSLFIILSSFKKKKYNYLAILFSFIYCLIIAIGSEFIQYFTAGRTSNVYDAILDTISFIIGLIITYLIYFIVKKIKDRINRKKLNNNNN